MLRRVLPFLTLIILAAPAARAQHDGQAFIHATVTWPSGESRTGYLRWENEEATWDDLFHCGYRENPWDGFIDHEALRKEKRDDFYRKSGLLKRLVYALHEDDDSAVGWRMLLVRFGDIQSFEIHSGDDDFVVLADGGRHQIGGYANDNGSDLWLYEKGQDPLEIEWNDLVSIVFSPAPDNHPAYARQLHGTVQSSEGAFTGPIMWDKSECLDIDRLDGENESGDLSLPMGEIRRIEKIDNRSVNIEKTDGSQFVMHGSNDVNADNRGIWILTADRGWVDIPWKRFLSVTFNAEVVRGRPRSAFNNSATLRGTVHLADGSSRSGRLVYDLDEGFAWDVFNGNHRDVGYDIFFPLIARIEKISPESCRLHLRSGVILELSENQDTGKGHGGVMVFQANGRSAEHLSWTDIQEGCF